MDTKDQGIDAKLGDLPCCGLGIFDQIEMLADGRQLSLELSDFLGTSDLARLTVTHRSEKGCILDQDVYTLRIQDFPFN